MRRTFKYRAYCNKETQQNAIKWLVLCQQLYNAALEQRIDAYQRCRITLSCYDQMKELTILKRPENFPEYKHVGSQVLKDVMRRLDFAYKAFFRRVKQNGPAGFPRFQRRDNYRSFTFPNASGWSLNGRHFDIVHVGRFKLKLNRPIDGAICTVTIKRTRTDKWFVLFSCKDVAAEVAPYASDTVGIDVGTMLFSMDSKGKRIPRQEFLEKELGQLRILQRKAARQRQAMKKEKRQGSKRMEQTYKAIRLLHERIANKRLDFICKLSRWYCERYTTIRVENLNIIEIIRKSKFIKLPNGKIQKRPPIARLRMLDAGWGMFFERLQNKAEAFDRNVERVPPEYTTMTCSRCGNQQAVSLAMRMFDCEACGLRVHRKLNAARNINMEKTDWNPETLTGIAALLEAVRKQAVQGENYYGK